MCGDFLRGQDFQQEVIPKQFAQDKTIRIAEARCQVDCLRSEGTESDQETADFVESGHRELGKTQPRYERQKKVG